MNTLYLRVPSRHSSAWPYGVFAYASCREDGSIIRQGNAALAELASSVVRANLVLLIAAADVTLLELNTPPMSESKLKAALPNLVEDLLMCDSRECVLIAGPKTDSGARTVAVAQRDWLQKLFTHFTALGANQVKAIPAQLCLPWSEGQCSVLLEDQNQEASLTLRSGVRSGVGMLQEPGQAVETWLTTVAMLAGPGPIRLQLSGTSVDAVRAVVETNPSWSERISVTESLWSATVPAAQAMSFNLMAPLQGNQAGQLQWKVWRWPVMLTVLVMLINIIALNYDYWNLKREAQALRQNMLQTYRTSFPKDTVVPKPLEQMRMNLDLVQRNSGQPARDDFTLLLSQFGAAWSSMNPATLPKLISVEYKEHALLVQLKADAGTVEFQKNLQKDFQRDLQHALDSKGLVLKKINADVWQVRIAK